MPLAKLGKTHHRHLDGAKCGAKSGRGLCVRRHGRGQAMEAIEDVEIGRSTAGADQRADPRIPRPHAGIESEKMLLRLDDDAPPAALVKPQRDVVGNRVSGSDVDIDTAPLAGEGERQMVVLHVLRVRKLHRGCLAGVLSLRRPTPAR
jgi:hypothetical protein